MSKLLLPIFGLALVLAAAAMPRADAAVSLAPAGTAAVGKGGAVEHVQMKCANRRVCRPGRGCAWRKVCKRW